MRALRRLGNLAHRRGLRVHSGLISEACIDLYEAGVIEGPMVSAEVLTTPRLSLPEVGGDAVAYTGPDPEEIARDLGALLDDEPRRAALAGAGLARAKEFSWDSSAEVHLASWSRAVSG